MWPSKPKYLREKYCLPERLFKENRQIRMPRKTGGEEERKTQFHSSKFFIHWQIYFTNIIVVVVFSKFKWKYMLYVRQWATWEENLWIFSISKQYMLTFKWKKKKGKGGNKFCQNYIFADSGRTLFKRLYEGIFSKGNLWVHTAASIHKNFIKKSHL